MAHYFGTRGITGIPCKLGVLWLVVVINRFQEGVNMDTAAQPDQAALSSEDEQKRTTYKKILESIDMRENSIKYGCFTLGILLFLIVLPVAVAGGFGDIGFAIYVLVTLHAGGLLMIAASAKFVPNDELKESDELVSGIVGFFAAIADSAAVKIERKKAAKIAFLILMGIDILSLVVSLFFDFSLVFILAGFTLFSVLFLYLFLTLWKFWIEKPRALNMALLARLDDESPR